MLGKVLKHEFKNSYFDITIVNGSLILAGVLNAMLIRTRLSLLYSLSSTALAGLIIASFVILLMNIVNSFNKKMFSSEGYLTFTLPVSVDNLLIGKLIVNMVWYLFTTFAIALSISLFIYSAISAGFPELLELLSKIFVIDENFILILMISIMRMAIELLSFLILVLFTLAILNAGKIRKNKKLAGFGIFFGLSIAVNWIKYLLPVIPYTLAYDGNFILEHYQEMEGMQITSLLDFNDLFWNVAVIVGMYFWSRTLIYKHLELGRKAGCIHENTRNGKAGIAFVPGNRP